MKSEKEITAKIRALRGRRDERHEKYLDVETVTAQILALEWVLQPESSPGDCILPRPVETREE
ncbi:MAG: hypothetical protein PHW17_14260 [Desulfobacterales bacterium]|jgi:hypothetical protein|nr:hypothetical protein [Desulfobacterales bacterium]